MANDLKEQYKWWKEEIVKKKIPESDGFLSLTIKNLNNGRLKYLDLIKADTNYLPENVKTIERLYHLAYDLDETSNKCKYCKKNPVSFISFHQGYLTYCSQECSFKDQDYWDKVQNTNMERYGSKHAAQSEEVSKKVSDSLKETFKDKEKKEEILSKRKKTYQEKTGYQHQMHNPEVVEKVNRTMLENYGVEKPLQNKDILEKTQLTNLDRYGNKCALLNEDVMKKSKDTILEKYGEDHWAKTKDGKEYLRQTGLERYKHDRISLLNKLDIELVDEEYQHAHFRHNWRCKKCNEIFETNWNLIQQGYLCPFCYPRTGGTSIGEQILIKFIKDELNLDIDPNTKQIIPPYELDIYIPSKNIAIEHDGLYWHSESADTPRHYHLNKTNACKEKGIRLIHIFEDELIFNEKLVKERLKHILQLDNDKTKVYARNCIVDEIDSISKNEFLDTFHLQGIIDSTVNLGAIYNNQIISVMTFTRRRKNSNIKLWELSRFCTNYNYYVPGIASKLLKYFTRNYEWDKIITYADKRWSDGNLYFKLGFKYVNDTYLNYWYVKGCTRLSRYKFKKKDLDNNCTRIWDCGNIKFEMINE